MSPDDGPSPFSPPARQADDQLPDVEPPSAGFIVQLFVIPGAIVAAVMLVTLLFNWIAHRESDPHAYLRHIEGGRINSWQAAHDLAIELGRRPELRRDSELADLVAKLIDRKLAEPLPASQRELEEYSGLIVYLVKTAAYFPSNAAAMQSLAAAANASFSSEVAQAEIHGAAIEAIGAVWSEWGHSGEQPVESELLWDSVSDAANDSEHAVKERAAYSLGVLAGWDNSYHDRAVELLHRLLDDQHPNVRYNAAAGLARAGDLAAVDVLSEMLDLEETAGLDVESDDKARDAKRVLILEAALEASVQLAAAAENSAEVAERLAPALDAIATAPEGDLPEGADDALRARAKHAAAAVRDPTRRNANPREASASLR